MTFWQLAIIFTQIIPVTCSLYSIYSYASMLVKLYSTDWIVSLILCTQTIRSRVRGLNNMSMLSRCWPIGLVHFIVICRANNQALMFFTRTVYLCDVNKTRLCCIYRIWQAFYSFALSFTLWCDLILSINILIEVQDNTAYNKMLENFYIVEWILWPYISCMKQNILLT